MRKTVTFLLGAFVVVWTGYTLSAIVRYGGAVLVDLNTTGRIMAVRNDELVHSAVGLTYHGVAGAILVVVEIVAVLAALWFGLRGGDWKKLAAVLVAWTALGLGNAIWLQTHGWNSPADFAIIVAAMFATLAWAGLCLIESIQKAATVHVR